MRLKKMDVAALVRNVGKDDPLAVVRRVRGNAWRAARAQAMVVLAPAENTAKLLVDLPDTEAWQQLHQRSAAKPLSVRTTVLASAGTRPATRVPAVLGYTKPDSSAFERLELAGRVIRELASARPASICLVVLGSPDDRQGWFEALLLAAWLNSASMPTLQNHAPEVWGLRRLLLVDAPRLDTRRLQAEARASHRVRVLTALPPNVLDARGYRALLTRLAGLRGLSLRWYGVRQLQRMGAGAFAAVARANPDSSAGIALLRWRGNGGRNRAGAAPDVALVGKGIIFDTGGINLKQHAHMLDMHTDMSGSAVALATLLALRELRSPLRVDAYLAITENNIGPSAYRPQEVVQALNGTTIQVIHSDAEGRMVLADTLALAARSRPRLTMDFATLTGAAVHALTERYSAVFSNRPALAATLLAAGNSSGERVWNFPLDEDFDSDLESTVADVLQCPVSGKGDHILAARFLQRFIDARQPWVHVDLASATRRGGLGAVATEITGFGARFALQFLRDFWHRA